MTEAPADDGVARLAAELALPVSASSRRKIAEGCTAALNPIYRLMMASGGPTEDGQRGGLVLHLFARAISDLVVTVHLAERCYLQQAHTSLRPVLEACDLLDLVDAQPEVVEAWFDPDRWSEFMPGAVRKKLGRPGYDETYGHVSEVGPHPRFMGMRASAVLAVPKQEGKLKQLRIRVGPFFPEHPSTIAVSGMVLSSIVALAFRGRYLVSAGDRRSEQDWLSSYTATLSAASAAAKQIRGALLELDAGDGSEFLDVAFDEVLQRARRFAADSSDVQKLDPGDPSEMA